MPAILTLTGPAAGDINLNDGTSYALAQGWTPAVAPMRRSRLAGGGPYADVREDIPLRVFGSSAPNTLAALRALVDAADQATRWKAGEEITPVLLNYRMSGSGLGANLSVPVWGAVDEASLRLSPTFNEDINAYEISPVILRLRRPGQWIGVAETPNSVGAFTHPNVFSIPFASNQQRRLMPLKLEIGNMLGSRDVSSNPIGSSGYLLVASHGNKIKKLEAEAATATAAGSGTFNNVADANASGGQIRRLQPTSAGNYTLTFTVSPEFHVDASAIYVLAVVVRNNSATINYQVQATLYRNSSFGYADKTTPAIIIDTSTFLPRIIQLGPIETAKRPDRIRLTFTPSSTSGSGNQLDVDVMVALQITDPTDRMVALLNINRNDSTAVVGDLVLEDRVLTHRLPTVREFVVGGEYTPGYRGDIYLLTTGDRVAVCLLGTTASHWRIINGDPTGAHTLVTS
ncbi:MAG: hypothetical protein KF770_10715, partial [Anaerolineae bacterium]|nr:hypothetical protein [Anaerolineae bacterium]